MLEQSLLAIHIMVVGYLLGSELVINSTYRLVSYAGGMPFADRKKLMDHVMNADQHVRYASVMQAGLGSTLLALLGYIPGGGRAAFAFAVAAGLWLALVEVTHRYRMLPIGQPLALVDRCIRYVLMTVLALFFVAATSRFVTLPLWLS